ncbi:hypothetical protein [Microbulbifer discodermiae]|uniref:hypothetical protein n=1 Tax=Microbulbifer sp. 2201CG32-9 TaxID=3232309 RepID=UPI00345B85EC
MNNCKLDKYPSPRKTDLQKCLGKLISAIQKEWGEQLGETTAADLSEDVMDLAHTLLQAKTAEGVRGVLGNLTIQQYLGDVWVQGHPNVKKCISEVENALNRT